ncbi:MAG: DUF6049 family protein [Acidimicrobiia bacterium]
MSRLARRVVPAGAALFVVALVAAVSLSGTAATAASTKPPHTTTPTTTHTPTTVPQTTTPASVPASTVPQTTTPASVPRSRPSRSTTTTTVPAPAAKLAAPGVSLVYQPPWVQAGNGAELLGLQLDEPAVASEPNAEVELTFHDSVSSRTGFESAVSATPSLGAPVDHLYFPFSSLQLNAKHQFAVAFGLSGSSQPNTVGIDLPGVYPVEVGLYGTKVEHSAFVTWMVVIDPAAEKSYQPLRVSWIWQLQPDPFEPPTGADTSTLAAMRPGGRLDDIAKMLSLAGSFPLTLGIGPEMLATWNREATTHHALASGLKQVRDAAARASNQLLPEPYVPIQGPTIEAEGLGSQLGQEYVAGSTLLADLTGRYPDTNTAFVDPVDTPTLDQLTQTLIDHFVVRDAALRLINETRTPAQPFDLTTSDGTLVPAAASDSGLEGLFDSPGPPALREQRVLAGLAEIANEAPSQTRGVILAMPDDWSPDATVSLLVHDLVHDPLVEPATLDTLFSQVAPATANGVALQRQLLPNRGQLPHPLGASEYATAVHDLAAYQAMVGPTDPSIAAGQHALLLALSTANSGPQAQAYLNTITANLQTLTDGLTTTAKTLTLTARRAYLPLSFQNNTSHAGIHVLVHLDSPKLIFPKGPDFPLTLPRGHSSAKQNEFPVEARASGTFVMTITLESPDGSVKLGTTSVTIRSTVFSGIGIALTLGALLFLAGWWGNHFVRTRRARRRARAT